MSLGRLFEFGQALCSLARENPKLCAITAAMQNGTGLTAFREEFRSRFFDVGISEEHAVTFAGGLAAGGMLPVFAVYSTFLQRAYDELIHDVSMQNTKVILAIDRAGVVGEDGKTHQGVFDAAYLQTIPNVTVYSPAYFKELRLQLAYLVEQGSGLCAIRYPRGRELYKPAYFKSTTAPYSVYGSEDAAVCLVTYGRVFSFAAECKEHLEQEGLPVKLLKLNRIIPLDGQAVQEAFSCRDVFFLEEGVQRGGIGEHFAYLLEQRGFSGSFHLRAIQDPFIKHAPMFRSLEMLGLNAQGIEQFVRETLGHGKGGATA